VGSQTARMARTVRNQKLDTRSARAKLPTRKSPYWVSLAPGCALGYRKGAKGGVWLAKLVRAAARRETTLGAADDVLDPDGVFAIGYAQAQSKAREWFETVTRPEQPARPYKVRDAVSDYLEWFRATGRKSISETEASVNAFILPRLGDEEVSKLSATQIRQWHGEIAASPPRLRTRPGRQQNLRDTSDDPEAPRRRQATANRILTVLKAALNHAWREGKTPTDTGWRRVAPFREADAARIRYLDRPECHRLMNACPDPLRLLVRGALLTGARYGELARMRVIDFHRDSGTLLVRQSKTGKVRRVELTAEGLDFFRQITDGRADNQFLFQRYGKPWGKSHQQRPLVEACRAAKVAPSASFHTLRHTYASLMVMDGVPLIVVARNLGHADTRMVDEHYGHLAGSYVREAIRSARAIGIADGEADLMPRVGAAHHPGAE
jgi:integrase